MSSTYTEHPKRAKKCVFCNYWLGDAKKEYVNSIVGYRYEFTIRGKCTKRNGASTSATNSCPNYEPSVDAKKLL